MQEELARCARPSERSLVRRRPASTTASRWYPGAIDRFREVLKDDPDFTRRDGVYFYLAESLARTDKKAEAIPYFERLLTEFPSSEYLEDAKERLQELKNQ